MTAFLDIVTKNVEIIESLRGLDSVVEQITSLSYEEQGILFNFLIVNLIALANNKKLKGQPAKAASLFIELIEMDLIKDNTSLGDICSKILHNPQPDNPFENFIFKLVYLDENSDKEDN
jgi:hypothetical protein